MKRLLLILILTFSFQSFVKAEDIRDFQIEEMSIGDSLLDHFTEEEINKSLINDYPNSDKYKRVQIIKHKRLKTYNAMHILYLKNDKNKKIHSLSGMIDYVDNIKACLNKKDIILDDISNIFKDVNIEDQGKRIHNADKSKKSFIYDVQIKFTNNDRVTVACFDWSKKISNKNNWQDNLVVASISAEILLWIESGYK